MVIPHKSDHSSQKSWAYRSLNKMTVRRQLEDGYEVIQVNTPCLLTAIKELNEPRYMNMNNLFGETDSRIKVWNAADIDVDLSKVGLEASPTNVFRSFTPVPKGKGVMIEGDDEADLANKLLGELKAKHVI